MNIVFSGPSGAGKGTLTEMFLKYLQSIGTYQKIMGYSNQSWSKEFSDEILRKFDSTAFITGEYLTYNCENLQRKLRRR